MQPYYNLLRPAKTIKLCIGPRPIRAGSGRFFHKHYNAQREEQTFRLTDGRTVGYAEYGSLEGIPAFFFHGSPGSRYDGSGFIEKAKKLNIRVITPDRPGHGLSSFQENRKLGNYARDISELAKHLGISRYHVFGQSGGGPYAIACAYNSPKDELLNAAVVAGMAPPAMLTLKDAGLYSMAVFGLLNWAPGLLRWSMTRSIRKMKDDQKFEKQLKFATKFIPEEQREEFLSPEGQATIKATIRAAYAQGPDGVLRDCELYGAQWDFELKDVKKKVKLFYGDKDTRTPVSFGAYYKKHLPNAELTVFEDISHWNMSKCDEQILESLLDVSR